ncbi:hypothetical protein SD80_012445 [Scytonema tolypothrichoides VB-61278]|nr:hypothetical protein SD80_012445 [Scytonema tolypothrichoides VB-61278]
MTESLEKRQQRLAQKQAQLQKLEAEVKTALRKRETQKLVILGRFLLELLERGIFDKRVYEENLDKFLVRNYDRAIFGLPLLEEEQPKKKKQRVVKTKTVQPAPEKVKPIEIPDPVTSVLTERKLMERTVTEADFNV